MKIDKFKTITSISYKSCLCIATECETGRKILTANEVSYMNNFLKRFYDYFKNILCRNVINRYVILNIQGAILLV